LANDVYENGELYWRGKYNEDTDLSLRLMKAGYHTYLFNAFVCGKVATLTMKGGNTKEVYGIDQAGTKHARAGSDFDHRRAFAESLHAQHPGEVKITQKFGRWHHHIDYRVFQNKKPTKKPGLNIPKGGNNYGMKLVKLKTATILDEQEELNVE
jgi:hypothetical protein